MKTLRNILIGVCVGVLIGGGIWVYFLKMRTADCHEAMTIMQGVNTCIETPGCFYDADDLIDANRALSYHKSVCRKDPA